ncbi:MAG: thioredoxin family protein [Hyphomicrobiales bacterium]|nr:thioredoxin family protein [Hyphomicrobiales bacterium]
MKLFLAAPIAILMAAPAMAGEFKPYNKAEFDKLIATGQSVLVHVQADWCPTCKRQLKVLGPMLNDPANARITAVTVNFDTETAFKQANRIGGQSTLIIYKGGKEVARSVGATDATAIGNLIAKVR